MNIRNELMAVALLLSLIVFISSYSEFLSTANAISQGSSLPDWAASWAGVPWDVENGEILVSSDFQDGKLSVNAKGQWIWRTGWIWKAGQWTQFEFPQTSQYDGWSQSSASAEIPLSSEDVLDGDNYVLAYTCNWKNSKWYCGCLDAQTGADGALLSCGRWQLQTFDAYRADGFSQDMSKVLSPDTPPGEKEVIKLRMNSRAAKLALTVVSQVTGDFNNDQKVDFDDFFLFSDVFGKEATAADMASALGLRNWQYYRFDLNGNGKVDFDDFFIFADNFGKTTQQAASQEESQAIVATKPVDTKLMHAYHFNYNNFADKFDSRADRLRITPDEIKSDIDTLEFSDEEYDAVAKSDGFVTEADDKTSVLFEFQTPSDAKQIKIYYIVKSARDGVSYSVVLYPYMKDGFYTYTPSGSEKRADFSGSAGEAKYAEMMLDVIDGKAYLIIAHQNFYIPYYIEMVGAVG